MRPLVFVALLLSASFALSQNSPAEKSKPDKDEVTIQGCVTRFSGDYVLVKQEPSISYELQATGKIRLKNYLGQRVEITGEQGPTLSSSSDALNKTGSASPVTITIRSIRTVDKECPTRQP
jgi:hypothetical protein